MILLITLFAIVGVPVFIWSSRFFKKKFNCEMDTRVIVLSALITLLAVPLLMITIGFLVFSIFDIRVH